MPIDGRDNFTYLSYSAGVAAISASDATYSGTVRISGGPNITVGTDSAGITISGAAGGGGGGGALSAIQGSNATYTSGTVVLTGSNAATVRSTTGQALVIDVPTQTAQTQNLHNVTLSGNTAGAMAQVSSGTMTLAGGNNITLSQAGNAITISGPNTSAQQTGISSIGASNTTYTSGGITLTGSNAVTVRSTTGQGIVIDAPVQTVQTQGVLSAGVSNVGNTAGNTTVGTGQRLVFAGAGAATLSQATGAGSTTISVSVPTGASATGNLGALAASNATYTSGTVTITGVGGGITVSSNTGQRIDLSVAAQTVQTQNVHNLTISGNTAGAGAAVSSGTLTLAGGNNITLSQAGNAITISGAAAGGAQTGISSIAASNTTYTSGGITFTGSNIVTVRSTTGQGIVIDASTSQSVQPGIQALSAGTQTATTGTVVFSNANGVSFGINSGASTSQLTASVGAGATATGNIGSIAWSNTTVTAGGLTITGSNAATVKSGAGPQLVIDVPTQTVQTQNVVVPAASNTTYTSGTFTITGVGGGVTVGSNTGQRIDISVAAPVAQTVQTQNLHNVTLSGNTAGVMAQISSGTMTLAGGNNITLSQDGNAITISGANAGGVQTGISSIAVSDSTYTSGSVQFLGSGAAVVRSTTGQGVLISVPAQTAQTGISSIGASNTTYTSGGITFTGSNMVTVRSTTGQGIVIDATQTVQTQGILSAGVSNLGNSAGNTTVNTGSRMVFVGAGAVTLSQTTGAGATTLSISAPTQTAQTGISGIAGSNATYTSGTVTITGVGGGVTVSSNTGQRIDISVAAPVAQTVQTQNLHNVTLSGNTAGVMAQISSGTLTLAGGNNITLSQNGNAVTISGAAGGGGNFSAGVSNLGNSAGSTGITGTRLVLVGTNNITLSQSTDANGGTVSISGGAGGGGGNFSAGVSNLGNSSGSTGITGTQLVMVGGNNVTLSQSTGANGGTVSISGPASWVIPTVSWFDNQAGARVNATAAYRTVATANGSWFVFPLDPGNDFFPGNMTVNTLRIDMSGSNTVTTASTGSWTLSASYALYTRNGSTLSLLNSGSVTIGSGAANASNSSLYHGRRWLTLGTGAFSGSSMTLSQDDYWMGLAFRSSGEAKLMSMVGAGAGLHNGSSNRSGLLGVGSSTGSSTMLDVPFLGVYTATSTAAPVSITKGQIARPANTGSANFVPRVVFDNIGVMD